MSIKKKHHTGIPLFSLKIFRPAWHTCNNWTESVRMQCDLKVDHVNVKKLPNTFLHNQLQKKRCTPWCHRVDYDKYYGRQVNSQSSHHQTELHHDLWVSVQGLEPVRRECQFYKTGGNYRRCSIWLWPDDCETSPIRYGNKTSKSLLLSIGARICYAINSKWDKKRYGYI